MHERATSVEGVRRTNLGAVLRLVHHEGARSRAVITAETGLNRSTVSDLVATLVGAGLVEERDPDPTRRVGRPSPIVAPSEDVVAIAINPEVDALEVGAVTLGGRVRARTRESVGMAVEDVVAAVARIVDGWRSGALRGCRMVGGGAAVPGLVRASDGVVRLAPHLGWRDEDIASRLAEATGLRFLIGNDASLGARAERLFGAARDHADVIYLNGGASGIGGGLVLHGMAIGGAEGYAGEWGQSRPGILLEADRRTTQGVLEDEVNRGRLLDAVGLPSADDAALARALAEATDGEVTGEIQRQRRILSAALANAVNALNPSVIVLGGFLAILHEHDPEGLLDLVRDQALSAPTERLEIRAAALGADRLLIGAAEAAFEPLLADPLA
ncbi:ROK family transcriptional regulator [Microbacterium paludicola]|uniref:ROK family transcriptional regulator n=1 Tax=Microbacterium paludicola TaxID=300019 RepID=A0A4Y9FYG0_9MICO|nr:ROK family transcriptional regulator [Microbacterium paludicola]MBF0815145.1 ROK family transcriptional regulator [Microbacterium paludicola]TFU34409.1 ROK family transcriptional regulator [Microbacterium paludicola]